MQEVSSWRKCRQTTSTAAAVHVISNNRMANRCEVDPDLMRPAGMKTSAQEIGAGEARKPEKIRPCVLPCTDDRHALSVSRVARDWLVHRESIGSKVAPGHRRVPPSDTPRRDCRAQSAVGELGASYDQQPGSILVEPMDQPSALWGAPGSQLSSAPDKGIYEGSGPVAGGGMNDHSSRLVHDEQIVILINDVDGDVLAENLAMALRCVLLFDGDQVRSGGVVGGSLAYSIYRYMAASYECCRRRPGRFQARCNDEIEPGAGQFSRTERLRRRRRPPSAQPVDPAAGKPIRAELPPR